MTKNRLSDLNDHLFAQIERLSEEGLDAEKIKSETQRANALVDLSDQVVRIADVKLQAARLYAHHGERVLAHLPQLGPSTARDITPATQQIETDAEGGA